MAVMFALLALAAGFNFTTCPASWEMQGPAIADFTLPDIAGFYYELAFHDYTQNPLCPFTPRCITSSKVVMTYPDGQRYVNDSWALNCAGHPYPQTLLFNETKTKGYVLGYVPTTKIPFLPPNVVKGMVFPDTIVDFKGGPDGWVIEVQCVHALGHVDFVGVNFYSKSKTEAAFQEMLAAAEARGLHDYLQPLHRVDHSNCPDEPHASDSIVV